MSKKWWDQNFQGVSIGWPPSINFGKNKKSKYDPAKINKILEIYDSIKKFISEIQTSGSCDINILLDLIRETRHSKILFKDNNIAKYVDSLYQKGLDLEFIKKQINKTHNKQQLEQLLEKQHQMFMWFTHQHDAVENIFKPYLND